MCGGRPVEVCQKVLRQRKNEYGQNSQDGESDLYEVGSNHQQLDRSRKELLSKHFKGRKFHEINNGANG